MGPMGSQSSPFPCTSLLPYVSVCYGKPVLCNLLCAALFYGNTDYTTTREFCLIRGVNIDITLVLLIEITLFSSLYRGWTVVKSTQYYFRNLGSRNLWRCQDFDRKLISISCISSLCACAVQKLKSCRDVGWPASCNASQLTPFLVLYNWQNINLFVAVI